ncbi:MAG: ElyC/SanA/YdcF family protein [Acidimicrobiales bacterium]
MIRRLLHRRWARSMIVVGLGASSCALSLPQLWAARAADGRVIANVDAVPERPVALVLGAGLDRNGFPTLMLADRVNGAVELYRRGVVGHLLMSGDNSRADYDEPTSMRRLAIEAGVPAESITLDFAGFSTFDSCVRARRIFGVRDAVVVTQDFHAARAVATCRGAGIDAVAFAQSTAGYSRTDVRPLQAREKVATVKALWDEVSGTRPHFLGEFVGLPGSASLPDVNQSWDHNLLAARSGR